MLRTKSLPSYPSLKLSHLPMPERSYFYDLEPIGFGTAYCESLSSYVYRLAHENCVLPNHLLHALYVLNRTIQPHQLSYHYVPRLDISGVNIHAIRVVLAIEKFTSLRNLSSLSLLCLFDVFHQRRLFHPTRTWCSVCYEEWYQDKLILYDPLLWDFLPLQFCPIHNCTLTNQCPYCQKKQSKYYLKNLRIGYCSHCDQWLGKPLSDSNLIEKFCDTSTIDYQKFIAENLGQLISLLPSTLTCPLRQKIIQKLSNYLEHIRPELRKLELGNIVKSKSRKTEFKDLLINFKNKHPVFFLISSKLNSINHTGMLDKFEIQEMLDIIYFLKTSIFDFLYN